MPTTTAITDWGVATWAALAAGLTSFFTWLPNLLGAALILLIGWGVASLLYTLTDKLLDAVRFDSLMHRAHIDEAISRSGVRIDPSNLIASLVKWTVLLVAFMMAAENLGLTQVSMGISAILGYIPNVIAAVVILGLGMLLANFVSSLVRGAAGSAGVRASDMLADLSYWSIIVFATLGAVAQLNIAPALVQTLYTAVIAALALAAALAFGLGLRDQAQDVVAGRALMDQIHEGDEIALENVSGRIQKIGPVKTLILGQDGSKLSVPNHFLTERIFRINSGGTLATAGGGGGGGQTSPHIITPGEPTHGEAHIVTPQDEAMPPLHRQEPMWRPEPEEET
jgi:small-conductance mechanosensitive channel